MHFLVDICGDKCLQYGSSGFDDYCENNYIYNISQNGYKNDTMKNQCNTIKQYITGESKRFCECGNKVLQIGEDYTKYCCSTTPCESSGNREAVLCFEAQFF